MNNFKTLHEIADAANMSLEELLWFAEREPRLKMALDGIPVGEKDTGIPPKPSELRIVLKRELATIVDD
jgi:hypothetical protein